MADEQPLRSVHTNTFPALLEELNISLLVTTCQAGKLVALRADEGVLNTHEMEWVNDELWFVNTLFSCLAVRSIQYSFLPKWQPPFITSLAPEDRCHLNGLGLRDGKIRNVTALGQSDEAAGWRKRKKDGGIVMDTTTNEILLDGLAMPHSPRWYNDKLWVLESGAGTIGHVDIANRAYNPIAEVPGFTRGLDFCGPVAFVGLSQVRESAVFSGIPITERKQERTCGVWAIHIQTGQILGTVRSFAAQRATAMSRVDLRNKKSRSTWSRTAILIEVGATRFERATSASQTRRSSQAELRPDML